MKPLARVFASLFCLALLVGAGHHYATTVGNHAPYPMYDDLKISPDSHVGEQVFLVGTVQSMNETNATARVRIDTPAGPFTAQVRGFEPPGDVQPGGIVQVFGTFQGAYEVRAENVRVVNPAGGSNLYKYAVSGVAALLVLGLFFRYWRVNIRELSVEAR